MTLSRLPRAVWIAADVILLLASGHGPGVGAETARVEAGTALLISGKAFVPARLVFEWLGAQVEYKGRVITATRGKDWVQLTVGKGTALRNDTKVPLAGAPVILQGRSYVPLRFVAEAFGADVAYDSRAKQVTISSGGRLLALAMNAGDPVRVGCEAFRAFLRVETTAGKNVVLFEADRYAWIRGLRTYDVDLHTWSGDESVEKDPRFPQVLRENGGQPGDLWYPYTVRRGSSTRVTVLFSEWNWYHSVVVELRPGGWEAVRIEGNGEGNEGNPPLRWRVERVGNQLKVSREE